MATKRMIITCMDPRIQEDIIDLTQKKNFFRQYYLVSNMGGSKYFLQGKEKDLLETIRIARVEIVIVIHHGFCLAYSISDPEEEKRIQIMDMIKTEGIIKSNLSGIDVIKVWADLDPRTERIISFEKVMRI